METIPIVPKTFDLTPKELVAAHYLVKSCLRGMGGKRPADLGKDEYTWIAAEDLIKVGYSHHEAAGLFSSLFSKSFIYTEPKGKHGRTESFVTTDGWKWFDTVWDSLEIALTEDKPEYEIACEADGVKDQKSRSEFCSFLRQLAADIEGSAMQSGGIASLRLEYVVDDLVPHTVKAVKL